MSVLKLFYPFTSWTFGLFPVFGHFPTRSLHSMKFQFCSEMGYLDYMLYVSVGNFKTVFQNGCIAGKRVGQERMVIFQVAGESL